MSFTIGAPVDRPVSFLSDDQLRSAAPSIFADSPHSSRSDRYGYIPTSRVVDGMRAEGFAPVKVQVSRVRDGDRRGFEKHLIRFRQVEQSGIVKVGDVLPEVVLVNSHDGSTSYKLSAGLFRLVCSNGLVRSAGELDEVRIPHLGRNLVADVIEGSFRVLRQAELGIEAASRWAQIQLTDGEQTALAIGAHHARFADASGNVDTPIQAAQLMRPRRSEDRGNDLWAAFNRIQENAIKGGLRGIGQDSAGHRRRVTTREVKGIDGNLNLNKAIWKMAEHLAELKAPHQEQEHERWDGMN